MKKILRKLLLALLTLILLSGSLQFHGRGNHFPLTGSNLCLSHHFERLKFTCDQIARGMSAHRMVRLALATERYRLLINDTPLAFPPENDLG